MGTEVIEQSQDLENELEINLTAMKENAETIKKTTIKSKTNSEPPKPGDPDWHDYVISLLTPDELDPDGNPSVDGLRRIVETLLGQIVVSESKILEYPKPDNQYLAVVSHTIELLPSNPEEGTKIYTDVADCSSRNCDTKFSVFATATAATRAEGRVLRKLLKLRKVVASEELEKSPEEPVKITSVQINGINLLCNRLRIKLKEFIKKWDINSLEEIDYSKAIEILKQLHRYQNKQDPIPSNIRTFNVRK